MKWFDGEIPAAIQTAKAGNNIFIVYITGEDDLSKKMDKTWEDDQVSQICQHEGCVAVQIPANSDKCSFFSQIYPVVVVPSTFFIGNNGTPLEVTGGYVPAEEFVDKIKSVVQSHKTGVPAPQTATPAPPSVPANETEIVGAASVVQTSAAAATSEQNNEAGGSDAKKPKIEMETKVERAQKLLEEKRLEKLRKEEEEVKRKELERIQMGREVQKLKQFQQERELKETRDQIKKDREDDRRARERVKEQIARDRAERAARFNKEKEEREKTQEEVKRAKLLAQQQAAAEAEARRSENARLQFRMPDGSSATHTFPSGEPLQNAYNFASERFGGAVTLSTTFPRRTFTQDDMSKSFVDLQLAPSAVIIVVPGRRSGAQQGNTSSNVMPSSGILSLILAPFMFLLNLLRSLFASPPPRPAPSPSTRGDTGAQAAGGDRNTGAYQRRGAGAGSTGSVSRTEGKVHRFRNNEDDDDESATWNGNSTQQM